MMNRSKLHLGLIFLLGVVMLAHWPEAGFSQQQKKPNILVIMGDDIGWLNPSCYNSGIMGYQTPNIDRIAKEGARFTDWYGRQSCTAGRETRLLNRSRFTGPLR